MVACFGSCIWQLELSRTSTSGSLEMKKKKKKKKKNIGKNFGKNRKNFFCPPLE